MRAVRLAGRTPPDVPAGGGRTAVSPASVSAFRARAMHLDRRLRRDEHARAARGGLQDSAPRAALLSLHARLEDATPDAWERPSLAQIWLRWADYVVPREDVDVFTLGTMPRDPTAFEALDRLGAAVAGTLGAETPTPTQAIGAIGGIPNGIWIRAAQSSGRFLIRWDARLLTLLPAPSRVLEPEPARLELARRFLGWLGPGSARRFARWAGIVRADAEETWARLAGELVPVSVAGKERWVLARDLDGLTTAEPVAGVRFLPQGDPMLYPDHLVRRDEHAPEREGVPRRLLNALTGRVLVDGVIAAAWARRGDRLTIAPVRALPDRTRGAVGDEAARMRAPIGKVVRIAWLEPGARSAATRDDGG